MTIPSPILDAGLWASAPAGYRKAPFPAFGGKSRVAAEVWARLGHVRNYVEPFCFSAAMLWKRPVVGAIETINDRNAFVANFWRAVRNDPDAVAHHADWPVNESDLHARHRWLVGSDAAAAKLELVREDPEAFDAKIAGWWCWGACCWIGSGWCDESGSSNSCELAQPPGTKRTLTGVATGGGNGVHRVQSDPLPAKLPHMDAAGRGVHGTPNQLPHMDAAGKPTPKRCKLSGNGVGVGVHTGGPDDTHRPQLADEFARGRGVNGHDAASACDTRSAWIRAWMRALSYRLRPVRVCCGHWDRVCDSPSTMTRLGTTGVFLDPPYRTHLADGTSNRTRHIYANDRHQDVNALCDDVQSWCLRWGTDPEVRIGLCGLEGEYPAIDELVKRGEWTEHAWKSNGGYGNRKGSAENVNARRERVWFSPACARPGHGGGLFA